MMSLFGVFMVLTTGVFCGDMGVPPTEASMRRIVSLSGSIEDPGVQWLMKQTDLMFIFVWNGFSQTPVEERQNLIQVIERFVSSLIRGPLGGGAQKAAAVFERCRLGYLPRLNLSRNRHVTPDVSELALSLAFDLKHQVPGLPWLLSDPGFPLDTERRLLLASLSSIAERLGMYMWELPHLSDGGGVQSREYLEILLDVYTKVENQYTWLCQQTGVDVAYTYRPMNLLRSRSQSYGIVELEMFVQSEILPMINDPQVIEVAKRVGICFDFALRHHPVAFFHDFIIDWNMWFLEEADIDAGTICTELMTKGFQWLVEERPLLVSGVVPTGSVYERSVLSGLSDSNPPVPMENSDPITIRVMRLVEVVALRVPEIRQVFQLIHDPISMSMLERILLNELVAGSVRIHILAYELAGTLGIPLLSLHMMRERYLSNLSVEEFEGLRRIISCMARLEGVVGSHPGLLSESREVSSNPLVVSYITYALNHPDEIEFISRGLQALTRLYKKFQEDPIRSDKYSSVARYRTMAGFLPAYLVFGGSERARSNISRNMIKFRFGLQWVIDHEWEFVSPVESLNELVDRNRIRLEVDSLVGVVAEFLDGRFLEFDEMGFAIDRFLRDPQIGELHWKPIGRTQHGWDVSLTLTRWALTLPSRIFAVAMQFGGMEAFDASLRAQLLRIVPLFIEAATAFRNGHLEDISLQNLYLIRSALEVVESTDQGKRQLQYYLQVSIGILERYLTDPPTTPTMGPLL